MFYKTSLILVFFFFYNLNGKVEKVEDILMSYFIHFCIPNPYFYKSEL